MKRTITSFVLCAATVALAACGATTAASYTVTFSDRLDGAKKQEVALAAGRVLERRVMSMQGTASNTKVDTKDKIATVNLTVEPAALIKELSKQVAEPFTLDLMRATNPGEEADITVQGNQGFKTAGVTQSDVLWVTAGKNDKDATKGSVLLTFTDEGKEKVKKVFQETKGKKVGLFLRGRLISSFVNSTGEARENILIEGVPSVELATAFADDVNVGTYTTIAAR